MYLKAKNKININFKAVWAVAIFTKLNHFTCWYCYKIAVISAL